MSQIDFVYDHAACAGSDTSVFFLVKGGRGLAAVAKKICAGCDVKEECLEYALATRQAHGIWGGTTERHRRRIVKELVAADTAT